MKFYKVISFIFHPILLPFVGSLYYFLITPVNIPKLAKTRIILLILTITYFIPIVLLFLLKKFKKIDNYHINKIEQRKRPLIFVIGLFSFLSWTFFKVPQLMDLALLFSGSVFSFLVMFFLFNYKIKTSIHMFGIGTFIGFLIAFSFKYQYNVLVPLILLFIISGFIGQSRLYLKAHSSKEIYLGFSLGVVTQVLVSATQILLQ